MNNPDRLLHAFSTFMGLPPDSETPPVCGAKLTSDYNGRNMPRCPECDKIMAKQKRVDFAGKI